ncbi:MAG: GIY-YIG nuclease family protein, partial [Sinomicrobium sp.]|nr:GIY-YIG nuclease family protein [Sinomicrobium sp.]
KVKYDALVKMPPATIATCPKQTPQGGVYMFSEEENVLYVGRTKRKIRQRLQDHIAANRRDCPFALRLAREDTGNPAGSKGELFRDKTFIKAYDAAKERIREMDVRYVEEPDPLRQALLEIYAAVQSDAKHNDFDTH